MSSMKKQQLFPPGGPNVLPCRFSTTLSSVRWKISGVVTNENGTILVVHWSRLRPWMNCIIVAVLDTPGAPVKSTGFFTGTSIRSCAS
eukprot:3935570-Rhodomonas_salina.1